jgi:peptidoglycan/xylan/chitin deacetylase (PgdA/CDA1 family)
MRFVIPAGRTRLRVAAVAGILVLGWLSGLGPLGPGNGQGAAVASAGAGQNAGAGRNTGAAAPGRKHDHRAGRKAVVRPTVDCRVTKCVALTFDDGPGPYTTRLLGMLAARRVRVTFFLIGGNIVGREAIVRQELAQGHAIGDHTWSHPDLSTLPRQVVRSQLARTLREITKATGGPTRLMRPPYGATDRSVGKVAGTLGMAQITWSVDTNDWRDRNSAIVAHRAIAWARRGDIILMHDIHPTTVSAVPQILRGLSKRGFTFVTVPELLAAHPIAPGKLYYHQGPIRAAHARKAAHTAAKPCTTPGDKKLMCSLAKHGFTLPELYVPRPLDPGR